MWSVIKINGKEMSIPQNVTSLPDSSPNTLNFQKKWESIRIMIKINIPFNGFNTVNKDLI